VFKAEELFQNITDKNHPDETVLTIIQGKGTLPREQAGRNIHYDDASLSNYKKVEQGDFIIHLRSFEGGLEMANEAGIVSPAYTILRCKRPHSSLFYDAYFHTDEFINHNLSKSVEGIRDGRQISYEAFKWLGIPYCEPTEQEKISNLFAALNERIAKQLDLIEALKKYKRGLSNSLFDRLSAGSESRLCIFGDMMTILQNNTFSRDNLSVGDNGVRNIHYGDVLIKYGAVLDLHSENVPVINAEQDISKFSALSYLRNGDVVFADTAEDYTVGKSTEIIGAENIAALSGLHTIPCRPQDSFVPMYLGYYFNSDYFKKQLYPMIQGTKVSSISKSEIIKTKIIVPCLQEQARIASIMSALDDRIDAAKHTTKDLIDLRSGLLQQLFI
jgi:type I restriction enzyme S subunit